MVFIYSFCDSFINSLFFQIEEYSIIRSINNDLIYVSLYIIISLDSFVFLAISYISIKSFYSNKRLSSIAKILNIIIITIIIFLI